MLVERVHPARLQGRAGPRSDVAVVIDVLRATTTTTELFARGVPELWVLATPQRLSELDALAGPSPRIVFSELDVLHTRPDRVDNSPVQARTVDLLGRTPVLVTTNGTRALDAAASAADQVWVASYQNVGAVAKALLRLAPERVLLLPAGAFEDAEPRTEDELCAEALGALLEGRVPAFADHAARIWNDERVQKRLSKHPSLEVDIRAALEVDRYAVLPRFFAVAPGIGRIRAEPLP